jgi:hypothetical protein
MSDPERRLHDDLDTIAPRAADEAFATSLYRALALERLAPRGLPESPPPPGHGERMAPAGASDECDRRAHEEADAELCRKAT